MTTITQAQVLETVNALHPVCSTVSDRAVALRLLTDLGADEPDDLNLFVAQCRKALLDLVAQGLVEQVKPAEFIPDRGFMPPRYAVTGTYKPKYQTIPLEHLEDLEDEDDPFPDFA
jgi:hypothetical protein